MGSPAAEHEKSSAALNSVAAAVFLTALKVVVGVWSGSIGILAEAAHSGLDFVAALVTYIAVRTAGRPPDAKHPYGHGKIENLSAMLETVLLLATCGWIIREAVERLAHKSVHVDASVWAFGVIAISIVVDVTRSRMLNRVAIKHRSQALEADALHFSSDVWSSAVVILGLIGVKVAAAVPSLGFLVKADATAALVVAGIVVAVSLRLGVRTVQALLDAAPDGVPEQVKAAVEAIDGVRDCHAVRIRHSGPYYFVDLHVLLDGSQTLEAAHQLTEVIELKVQGLLPEADITVHPEPWRPPAETAPGPEKPDPAGTGKKGR
jgi:cation diffusion facilitator family transporter